MRLLGLFSLILILSRLINIQEREPCFGDFMKNLKAGLHSDTGRLISYMLSMMIDAIEFYSLMPMWMTFKVTVDWESDIFCANFLPTFSVDVNGI